MSAGTIVICRIAVRLTILSTVIPTYLNLPMLCAQNIVIKYYYVLSTVNDVKLRWKRLRDNFRVSIKRTKGLNLKPGLPFVEGKPWKYQKEMEFLLPFMQIGGLVITIYIYNA